MFGTRLEVLSLKDETKESIKFYGHEKLQLSCGDTIFNSNFNQQTANVNLFGIYFTFKISSQSCLNECLKLEILSVLSFGNGFVYSSPTAVIRKIQNLDNEIRGQGR